MSPKPPFDFKPDDRVPLDKLLVFDTKRLDAVLTCLFGCAMGAHGCEHFTVTLDTTEDSGNYVATYTRKPTAKGREAFNVHCERLRAKYGFDPREPT